MPTHWCPAHWKSASRKANADVGFKSFIGGHDLNSCSPVCWGVTIILSGRLRQKERGVTDAPDAGFVTHQGSPQAPTSEFVLPSSLLPGVEVKATIEAKQNALALRRRFT